MSAHSAPAPAAQLVAGIGCRQGAWAEELIALIEASLQAAGPAGQLAALATLERKADHPAIAAAAAYFGVPVIRLTADTLATVGTPNPSARAHQQTGLESIAEAAVLATGELLVEKQKSPNATCAIGRLREWDH